MIDNEQSKKIAISYKSFERKKALARRKVYSSDKKYRFSLFIGDSKTPIGEFSMTFSECKRKNLEYESKFIKSNDPTYRMRVLMLTTESKKEMGKDIRVAFDEVCMESKNY